MATVLEMIDDKEIIIRGVNLFTLHKYTTNYDKQKMLRRKTLIPAIRYLECRLHTHKAFLIEKILFFHKFNFNIKNSDLE